MQNSKCHLSCLNVLDAAAGLSEWLITCTLDGHTRNESVDCPYANELELERLSQYIRNAPITATINPTAVIFHAMNNQKGSVSMESNTERHKRVCYELNALYDRKNRDYGDSFHETYQKGGIKTAWLRIHDKFKRFENLALGNPVPNIASETMRDTLIDMCNYIIMTVMELDAETEPPKYEWTKEN